MTYYNGEINVISDDPQKRKTVAEAIRKHLIESAEFADAPWIGDINYAIPEICWSRYGNLVYKLAPFLESLTRDSGVEIKTNESSNSDGLHTVSWWFQNGQRMKVLDRDLYVDDIDVAHLAGLSLLDKPYPKTRLAGVLGRLDRDEDCHDNVCTLMSVMSVIEQMKIKPSDDDVLGWLRVHDFFNDLDTDVHSLDGHVVFQLMSYIEQASLMKCHGISSTPKSHAATI